jgi:DNA repair protein RadC
VVADQEASTQGPAVVGPTATLEREAMTIEYEETEERMVLAEAVLGEPEEETGKRITARQACASQRAKFGWMRFDVCVHRTGGTLPSSISQVGSSKDAEKMFRAFLGTQHLELKEIFGVIALDAKNRPLGFAVPGTGGVTFTAVDPLEVFKPPVLLPAAAIIVCHNHPSGDNTPSAADVELTNKLVEMGKVLGVKLLDHLILVADKPAFSFLDRGLMSR